MALINTTTTGVLGSTFYADGTGDLTIQQNGVLVNKITSNGLTYRGTGSVLQVINATTIAAISTSSTSFVTTGFSVSITPSSSSSKVFVFVNGGGIYNVGNNRSLHATIYRGATNLGDATYGLERFFSSGEVIAPHSMSVLDSPATTSSTTYTCYFRSGSAAEVQFSAADRATISFTAMEIAA
jgi:hypothetical protein